MILHIDSVQKSYDNRSILRDVFLQCKQGQVLGILGRNGCGKSTLLKIVHHSTKADFKYVKVGPEVILSQRQAIKYINYLPQDGYLPKNEKVITLLKICVATQEREQLLKHPLIKNIVNQKVSSLSGGEQRLLEVLILLHSPAPFLLLDEPFNGVAPLYVQEIKELIKSKLSSKGVILTDHSYRNVLDVSDTLVVIKEGRSIAINDESELIGHGYLSNTIFHK